MQFSKQMIEWITAIRRKSPPEFKHKIKLTSQTLFDDLLEFYYLDCPTSVRPLVRALFKEAGEPWASVIEKDNARRLHKTSLKKNV